MKPEELRYAKTHEWVHLSGGAQKTATVGISAFAVEALTDLVFIELPAVGRKVKAGAPIGEVESVKAVSDLYSPVSGEVTEVNTKVADRLESLATDPYGEGWLFKLKVSDDAALGSLMSYDQYQKQIAEEGH